MNLLQRNVTQDEKKLTKSYEKVIEFIASGRFFSKTIVCHGINNAVTVESDQIDWGKPNTIQFL